MTTKPANQIKYYMTETPHTIGEEVPLSKAIEVMREHRVRHLPVEHKGKLVGVLSDRDVKLALTVHPCAKDLVVGDVMTEEPYAVAPETSLQEVTTKMAKHKFGCAVIKNERGAVLGIFTAIDALALIGEKIGDEDFLDFPMRFIS